MPTLRDTLKLDTHLGAAAEHGGYVLTAVKDRSTGYNAAALRTVGSFLATVASSCPGALRRYRVPIRRYR